jgi:hypothetical protein
MNRRTLLFTALGLTVGASAALAAGHAYAERHDDDHHRRRPGHHDREHGEREREGGRGRRVAADPNPATAPVPRNGLFQNGARPKVDVQ